MVGSSDNKSDEHAATGARKGDGAGAGAPRGGQLGRVLPWQLSALFWTHRMELERRRAGSGGQGKAGRGLRDLASAVLVLPGGFPGQGGPPALLGPTGRPGAGPGQRKSRLNRPKLGEDCCHPCSPNSSCPTVDDRYASPQHGGRSGRPFLGWRQKPDLFCNPTLAMPLKSQTRRREERSSQAKNKAQPSPATPPFRPPSRPAYEL